jgi:dTDP-4-amino-4,6-dideoxygalactose transaminase
MQKRTVDDLAVFGGRRLFERSLSTSNLLQPDIKKFFKYSRLFFDQHHYTNNGPNVRSLERRLAEFHETEFCVTFCSGFWAIALAASALAIKGRTEIVMPSLTYRRMTDIAAWVGLKPHFCEVDPTTLAMTSATVAPCVNENTALILGVHPIVNCCDAEDLVAFANSKNIPIMFDSVESIYESTSGGRVGGFGRAEAFSLHACKLLNGFGGGYLTTNDAALANRLALARGFGFQDVDTIVVPGGLNAKLNEVHAAMALASLDDVEAQIGRNRDRYRRYQRLLAGLPGVRLLEFDERYRAGYKNIVVELTDDWPLTRAHTISVLNAEGILARAHYAPPLHRKTMAHEYVPAHLPLTDQLAEKFLNLPCGHFVNLDDIQEIAGLLAFISVNAARIDERLNAGAQRAVA